MSKFELNKLFKNKIVNENGLWIDINAHSLNDINIISTFTLNKVFVFNVNNNSKLNENVVIVTDDINTFIKKYTNVPITYIKINYIEPCNSILFLSTLLNNIVENCIIIITYPSKQEQKWLLLNGVYVEEIESSINHVILKVISNNNCLKTVIDTLHNNRELVKVINKRPAGNLWHYCHFIVDCLVQEYKNFYNTQKFKSVLRQKKY